MTHNDTRQNQTAHVSSSLHPKDCRLAKTAIRAPESTQDAWQVVRLNSNDSMIRQLQVNSTWLDFDEACKRCDGLLLTGHGSFWIQHRAVVLLSGEYHIVNLAQVKVSASPIKPPPKKDSIQEEPIVAGDQKLEEVLEEAYWDFDAKRKTGCKDERTTFKNMMRSAYTHSESET